MNDKYDTIIGLLHEQNEILRELLELNKKPAKTTNGMYTLWDEEQEDFLISAYSYDEKEIDEICTMIKEKFDITRSKGALLARLTKLRVPIRDEAPLAKALDERDYSEVPF